MYKNLYTNFIKIFSTTVHCFPLYGIQFVLELIGKVSVPFLTILLPKFAIDFILGSRNSIIYFGLTAVFLFVLQPLQEGMSEGKYYCYNSSRNKIIGDFFKKIMDYDYDELESKEGQKKIQKGKNALLWGDGSGPNMMHQSSLNFMTCILSFVLYMILFANAKWWLMVIVLFFSTFNYFNISNASKKEERLHEPISEVENKLNYIEYITGNAQAGKDIRIFKLKGLLYDYIGDVLRRYIKQQNTVKNYYLVSDIISGIILFLRDYVIYMVLIYLMCKNEISVGDFVLYSGAASTFGDWLQQLSDSINSLRHANMMMNEVNEILMLPDISYVTAGREEHRDTSDIQIKKLDYKFKDTGKVLFKNLNMHLCKGEKVAIVGANGAGKSTLVHILCGLYHLQNGEVLIDNKSTHDMQMGEQQTFFSVVFQNVTIFPLSVAENIALCNENEIDYDLVEYCLQTVGLWDSIQSNPKGMKAPMGKTYDSEGIVLSGGQQQMLQLARALYKNAPIFILDEPTAALDALMESTIYHKFNELSKDRTTIFISHRLASTQFCDLIIVLKNGKIVEAGKHKTLLQNKKYYEKMYKAQSEYYQEDSHQ